ncbi:MAG TPA: winged helix-turn-helix domain-containing protein, partial [Pyrinomonadaceae bacterium]|nr:winged helix-turn-helix domain-containing protein [Pyrinomonadaceae bacterium]
MYEFGPFRLQMPERTLLREGRLLALTPKAVETLRVLVERWPHVVEKDELLREVWGEVAVEEATLAQNVFTLRKALGGGCDSYIVTVPKRGYRFAVPVRHHDHPLDEEPPIAKLSPPAEPSPIRLNLSVVPPSILPSPTAGPPATVTRFPSRAVDAAPRPIQARLRQAIILVVLLLLIICGAALAFWLTAANPPRRAPSSAADTSFQRMKMDRLTSSGNTSLAVISPDGKYIVYVSDEFGEESLWIKQVISSNAVRIIPPGRFLFRGITFSPDGNYVYYTSSEQGSVQGNLHLIPALGGTARKILDNVAGPVTFSPDGGQIAFFRLADQRASELVVANVDGSSQRVLARRMLPEMFVLGMPSAGPSWSPDGRVIACPAASFVGTYYSNVVTINVADGTEAPLSDRRWYRIGSVQWLADGSGLIVIGVDQESGFVSQIWRVSYPSGEVRKITNDLNDYNGISLTSDAKTLLTVQNEQLSQLWIAPRGEVPRARQLTTGKNDGADGVAWLTKDRLVYTSLMSGSADVWLMNADGSDSRQVTMNGGVNLWPTVSPGEQSLVVSSNRTGNFHLWRIDLSGGEPKQLTTNGGELQPRFSPDGRWVIYSSFGSDTQPLWRIDAAGREAPQQLTEVMSLQPAVSPDGKMIACFYDAKVADRRLKIAVLSVDGGKPLRILDYPATVSTLTGLQWSADGRALLFVNTLKGVSNIWSLPINGQPPRQVTQFKSDRIFRFAWSPDEKQLALARGTESNDAVL